MRNGGTMANKVIEFEGKKYKLPCDVVYDDCELVHVENPYSGEKCILPRFARGVYVAIKNAEVDGKYNKMQKHVYPRVLQTQSYLLLLLFSSE